MSGSGNVARKELEGVHVEACQCSAATGEPAGKLYNAMFLKH